MSRERINIFIEHYPVISTINSKYSHLLNKRTSYNTIKKYLDWVEPVKTDEMKF